MTFTLVNSEEHFLTGKASTRGLMESPTKVIGKKAKSQGKERFNGYPEPSTKVTSPEVTFTASAR